MTYENGSKRIFDVLVGGLALLVTSPLLIAAYVLVRGTSRGPGVYVQSRVGRYERVFKVYKIRTMVVDNHRIASQTYDKDSDVLFVGRYLRRFKIDELPQLFNVVVGDMSLIGPRPCLVETANQMPDWARRRFVVRPGMTGLAQVNGNVALSWEDRWKYDVLYTENLSFITDIKIIGRTILVLLMGEERFKAKS